MPWDESLDRRRSLLQRLLIEAITDKLMTKRRIAARTILLLGTLGLTIGCEQKPLPPPTSASATVASTAPSAVAPTLTLNPEYLKARPGEYTAPRRVLARIQRNLERIAGGKEPVGVPEGIKSDALESFVPAYRLAMSGDVGAAPALANVVTIAKSRLAPKIASAKREESRDGQVLPKGHDLSTYVKQVSEIAEAPVKDAEGLLVRLVATMRLVDAALLLESGHEVYDDSYDLFVRYDEHALGLLDRFRDASWIQLPCSTILTHRKAIEAADKRLGLAAGRLLSCPVAEKKEHDYDLLEQFAKSPGEQAAALVVRPEAPAKKPATKDPPKAPEKPWNWDQAIDFMDEDVEEADKVLSAASAKNAVGKLDYVLFLQAFRPQSKTRDEKIKQLAAEVDKASIAAAKNRGDEFLAEDTSLERRLYDGSDESLLGTIRLASSSGLAETTSSFYAIPCAILLARPKLLEATEPIFGGGRDNFLPRSGCGWGRGFVKGFPDADLDAWREITQEADGKFLFHFTGTMRFGLGAASNAEAEGIRTNPRNLLKMELPSMAWPYETWSYMTPESRTIYKKLLLVAEPYKAKLIAYYKTRGLSADEAGKAAQAALFQAVWGAQCGKAGPLKSLRKLIADGASPAEIRAFAGTEEYKDEKRLEPFRECAKVTGLEPLIHMAVLNPDVMPVLWELFPQKLENAASLDVEVEVDPNMPNAFGKTPLMVAAQQNQVKAAKLLIEHGASIERTTYRKAIESYDREMAHDARTVLMYAAARGSLELIRLLLDKGADKYAADTRGLRAVHYLLGYGPVAANPVLSNADMAEAAKLLY